MTLMTHRDAREDARAKKTNRRQNADTDVVPFTITFNKRQRQATKRMLIIILHKSL